MNVFTKSPRKSLRTSWSTLHVYVQKFLIENTRDGALRSETFYWDGLKCIQKETVGAFYGEIQN